MSHSVKGSWRPRPPDCLLAKMYEVVARDGR